MFDATYQSEAPDFLKKHPEVTTIDLLIADMNGVIRGKRVDPSVLKKAYGKGICLPESVFSLDIRGDVVEESGIGLETGDGDKFCFPIPGTLTMVPWQKRPTAQLLMTMHHSDRSPLEINPRQVLSKMLERFKALKLRPVVAVELEFYLLDKEFSNENTPQPPLSPVTGKRENNTQVYSIDDLDDYAEFLEDVINSAQQQGIPADTIIAEYAPGQFEVNLHHIDDPLTACDHGLLLKRVIKGIANKHGFEATFMAKPYPDQAGNGLHIHISLLDEAGNNAFANEDGSYTDTMMQAVAGLLDLMPSSMALFCPSVNSYRRFSPEFYTPNAPSWGKDNRTTALRIPSGDREATRIEHRVSGADANPYLVMSSLLAGIHHGLAKQLTPPPVLEGNAYNQLSQTLADNLRDALRLLGESDVMAEYLGKHFLDTYICCKEHEMIEFEKSISDLEYKWYLRTV
ncbi:glutamine synthetase family protein [Aestuariirhabdus sp. Z084]|uniref:glutamine synthetase family protein n=1 Tax=Aestuariirhabdus haliotis TaxID=2918751 RepID=UPI00201B3860|nr:glutamine synthetase family protein [Aestuariirhabdus haliotis]MCL6414198.1 glutamine synthetase family protein [Aestuariirhabdus haliotis]MCL6418130.1 glutamine synthetase family protein [Aestuariirhabdus haliotis]